jgi:hypothetical protein
MVFLWDIDHHLAHHVDYLANTKSALTPNGRVVIIDFYDYGRSGTLGFSKRHLISKEHVFKDMEQAGFALSKEHTFLPRQYFLEFVPTKDGSPARIQS